MDYLRRSKPAQILAMLGPGGLWLLIFFFFPLLIILAISFYTKGRGGPELPLTLEHYARVGEADYLTLAWRSVWIALVSTILTALIAYPVTTWIVRLNKKWRDLMVFLVMIPFWSNFLLRTYALRFTMLNEGPFMQAINSVLMPLLGWDEPGELLFTQAAVMIGLVYGNLPFMILPLYASLEKFDWSLLEAANDLGANVSRSFWRVMLPLTAPGLIAGSILVFVPALGNYITVEVLGGGTSQMIGRTIAQQFGAANNWPFGGALSLVMMVIVTVAAVVYFRVGRGQRSDV